MDYIDEAKENYEDAKEYVREQYARIREDFRFSNPSDPKQWSDTALSDRKGRPTLILDRTNKYIQHVVNKHREAKTSADIIPSDGGANSAVAEKLKGIIRHIEYTSKADIAWDTASDHQARGGLGWVRILPKLIHPESNEQELIIARIHDPTSCMLEAGWTSPDGSDAMCGFIETTLTKKQFAREWRKAQVSSFDSDGWFGEDSVRICEYFKVTEELLNKIVITGPDGGRMELTEDDYHALSQQIGYQPRPLQTYTAKKRVVKWSKITGIEILEETIFPSQWIGLVPVIGHELWVEDKRYLCGLVRRLMDGQRLHNIEQSARTEAWMLQPKAPFTVPERAIAGHEEAWQKLNSGSPAYLPYNDMEDGQPVAPPSRLAPPNFPSAYSSSGVGVIEMEESVGMHRATFGQQSNAVSGRAKFADQTASETATYHFADNRRIAQEQIYRIAVDMIPSVYKHQQQAKILGEDGKQSTIGINPDLKSPTRDVQGKVVAINPGIGTYGVRVKIGPSYSTIREELGTKMQELGKGNPALAAALTPMLLEMSDMPEEAKKVTRVVMAMLPPEVQKAYESDDSDIPPQAKATIDQQGQQIQQMAAAMDQAANVIKDLQEQVNDKSTSVQAEVKAAIAQIQTAKGDLEAQAQEVDHKKALLNSQVRIAQLELQLAAVKNQTALDDQVKSVRDEFETAMKMKDEEEPEVEKEDTGMALAKIMATSQEMMAKAMDNSTKTIAKLQGLTVDALEDVADALSAPREVQIQRGKDGKASGAKSVAVMPAKGE